MNKRGFTLIELLAVIVILAIIALIATPIILGIINDARKESNERSVELYASAVRNAIAAYQLTGTKAPESFEDLDIEYDGDVVCATEELYENGSFYIADCTVNGTEVEYTYGEIQEALYTQVYKPQYYYFGYDFSGAVGTTAAPAESERLTVPPTGEVLYLGYDVTDGVVSVVYACFVRNHTEYCLKGFSTESYATNVDIIKEAYVDAVDTDSCSFGDDHSYCYPDLIANAHSNGDIYVDDGLITECHVDDDGNFACSAL